MVADIVNSLLKPLRDFIAHSAPAPSAPPMPAGLPPATQIGKCGACSAFPAGIVIATRQCVACFAASVPVPVATPAALAPALAPAAAAPAAGGGGSGRWLWEDGSPDSGQWRPYDSASSALLSKLSVAGGVAAAATAGGAAGGVVVATLQIKGEDYTVDFTAMTQTKKSTGFVRAVRQLPGSRRPAAAAAATCWEYEDNQAGSGNWCKFDALLTAQLAAAAAAREAVLTLQIKGGEYTVDLAAMTQTRKSTGFVRALRQCSATPSPAGGGVGGQRLQVGNRVQLAPGCSGGCMSDGGIGVIVEDDGSQTPFKVQCNGSTSWAKEGQIVAAAAAAVAAAAGGGPGRPAAAAPGAADCWEYEDGAAGSGKWRKFETALAAQLTAGSAAGLPSLVLSVKGHDYDVDLLGPTQTRRSTGVVRSIRCCPAARPPVAPAKRPPNLHTFPGTCECTAATSDVIVL